MSDSNKWFSENNDYNNISYGPLAPGVILLERYRVEKLIKTGGMGAVYKVLDEGLNKVCALKELVNSGSYEGADPHKEWFKREARILASLDHPNLPKVFDFFTFNEKCYLVMTFVEGQDLDTILKRDGNPGLPEEMVVSWAREILLVLEYLHTRNPPVVYRDIKPANIMINNTGKLTLVDFGIARPVNPGSDTTKTCVGTPAFAPEEIFQGKPEPRSDLYSLGATMHYLLAGKYPVPFKPESVTKYNPSVSETTGQIILKALQPDPDARFSGASEMRKALKYERKEKEADRTENFHSDVIIKKHREEKKKISVKDIEVSSLKVRKTSGRGYFKLIGSILILFILAVFSGMAYVYIKKSNIKPVNIINAVNVVNKEDPEDEVKKVINRWAAAVNSKNLSEHMDCYDSYLDVYFTQTGVSKDFIYNDKENALNRYYDINRISISNLDITFDGKVATAVFDKDWYFTGEETSEGSEKQRLKLMKLEGHWKIISEEELDVYEVKINGKKVE